MNESPRPAQTADIPIRDVLYKRRLGPKEYSVLSPPAELLERYLEQVEGIRAILITKDRASIEGLLVTGSMDDLGVSGGSGSSGVGESKKRKGEFKKRGDIDWIMMLLESGKMDERRYILLAIAILTGVNRSKGLPLGGAILKALKAGEYPLEKIFEKEGEATCIDVSVLNKELAFRYGIKSDIYTEWNERAGHRFLVTDTQEVIDGWSPLLFYFTFDEFKQSYSHARFYKERYDGAT